MKKCLARYLLALILLSACSSGDDGGTTSSEDDDPIEVDRSQNLLATGASANDLLSNTNFDRILIEAAFVTGFRPTQQTMDNFIAYLRQHTFKENIDISFLELPSPEEETLTLQQVAALETENRTAYNNGTTLAVYIYFADAPSDTDEEDEGLVTLGAVYRNTSMVIFERTIRTLSGRSGLITLTDVETATLNHEFGHLFGLVNLGTIPVNDHEDTTIDEDGNEVGNNHCNVDGCLMRAQLEFGGTARVFPMGKFEIQSACSLSGMSLLNMLETRASRTAAVVPVLDSECVLDLQNNGGR
ncbi:MAG: hypothetical protein AAF717_10665 [Bacteroidota bacterium]